MRRLALFAAIISMALFVPCGAAAKEIKTRAQLWKAMSPDAQAWYVMGIQVGCESGVTNAMNVLLSGLGDEDLFNNAERGVALQKKMMAKCLIEDVDLTVMAVGKFYEDPANAHVSDVDAIDISILTMKGKPVDSLLREARYPWYKRVLDRKKRQKE